MSIRCPVDHTAKNRIANLSTYLYTMPEALFKELDSGIPFLRFDLMSTSVKRNCQWRGGSTFHHTRWGYLHFLGADCPTVLRGEAFYRWHHFIARHWSEFHEIVAWHRFQDTPIQVSVSLSEYIDHFSITDAGDLCVSFERLGLQDEPESKPLCLYYPKEEENSSKVDCLEAGWPVEPPAPAEWGSDYQVGWGQRKWSSDSANGPF
jgi:hypothetical protein